MSLIKRKVCLVALFLTLLSSGCRKPDSTISSTVGLSTSIVISENETDSLDDSTITNDNSSESNSSQNSTATNNSSTETESSRSSSQLENSKDSESYGSLV